MKTILKIALITIILFFLWACNLPPINTINHLPATEMESSQTLTPTVLPSPTSTPTPSQTSIPIPTATVTIKPTLLPTKQILLQFGIFGGDGGCSTDFYLGRDTPNLILYKDGQLIVKKRDDVGIWFEETKLTVPQICSLLSRIQNTGFFNVTGNGSLRAEDPIYKFDKTTEFSEGGASYIIQINGPKHKQVQIYYDYSNYLIPEVKRALDIFKNFSSPRQLLTYQPQQMLLWIENGYGEFVNKSVTIDEKPWPVDLPPLKILENDRVETGVSSNGCSGDPSSQVWVKSEYFKPITDLFGDRLHPILFRSGSSVFYVISRPLLPHETLSEFPFYPYHDEEFNLPYKCNE